MFVEKPQVCDWSQPLELHNISTHGRFVAVGVLRGRMQGLVNVANEVNNECKRSSSAKKQAWVCKFKHITDRTGWECEAILIAC